MYKQLGSKSRKGTTMNNNELFEKCTECKKKNYWF